MVRKILLSLLVLVVLLGAFAAYIQLTYKQDFSPEYPVQEMSIEMDSVMVLHGKYLAYGPAHCAHCHVPLEDMERVEAGEELPMRGGLGFNLPIATLYSPNLTSDRETGIGNLSDGTLYRMLRYNINRHGEAGPELMPFSNMSEYDIKSIIAFLRTQPAVRNEVPLRGETFIWKALQRFAFQPIVSPTAPPENVERDSSMVYGKYLAESVANCRGCHTARDMKTGEYTGPFYSGGMVFEPGADTKGWKFITPNLTSDPRTGIMASWSEEAFIKRFRMGRVNPGSPMPWGTFSKMEDSDLKALYRFLKSLEPIQNPESGKSIPPTHTAKL